MTSKTAKIPGPFTSYEYGAENKLVRAVTNGTTANYRYDGLGRRVEKEVINVGTTVGPGSGAGVRAGVRPEY